MAPTVPSGQVEEVAVVVNPEAEPEGVEEALNPQAGRARVLDSVLFRSMKKKEGPKKCLLYQALISYIK